MIVVALILHTLMMGGLMVILIANGHPVIGVVEYVLTLVVVVAFVRPPWRIRHGTLYLKDNIFVTHKVAVKDVVAIERHVRPEENNRTLVRFEIALRDGSRRLFVQQLLGNISLNDIKLSAVTSWMPASAAALAAALQVPLVEASKAP